MCVCLCVLRRDGECGGMRERERVCVCEIKKREHIVNVGVCVREKESCVSVLAQVRVRERMSV